MRYAKFPYRRSIDDFDYEFQPSVDRKLVEGLATLRFIEENRPILFLGQPGCGKTHLAVALATLAVEAGYRGYFSTADNLCRTLVRASIEGNLTSKMKAFTAPAVLVIDDMHNAIVFNIKGQSWRPREHNGLEIATANPSTGDAR